MGITELAETRNYLYAKAVERVKNAHGKKDSISDYDVIIELEREIDYYREKLRDTPKLTPYQETAVMLIMNAINKNGYNVSINIFKDDEREV